ncbi:hypothetical protein BSKO_08550 [Bryopsis sp. KO-2023]|nr:hypothetical protein BSKO_08550 [Bryopsis sp. KO-2023]
MARTKAFESLKDLYRAMDLLIRQVDGAITGIVMSTDPGTMERFEALTYPFSGELQFAAGVSHTVQVIVEELNHLRARLPVLCQEKSSCSKRASREED